MHGPGGNDYPMKGVFTEVKAPERLVFTNVPVDKDGNHLMEGETIVTLTEQGGKTTLTVTVLHKSRENRDMHLKSGMENGAGESYDRLAAVVAAMADAA